LSRAEARRFGLVVGAAFLGLGLLVWWRGGPLMGQVFGTIGVALIVSGIILPHRLGPVYRAWMALALVISKVTTPIFLGLVYFGIITPIGLVRRVFGHDALKRGPGRSSWVSQKADKVESGMRHQF